MSGSCGGCQLDRGEVVPMRERRAIDHKTITGQDLSLAVKRQVISVSRDEHIGDQRLRRQTTPDQTVCCRRLHDAIGASPAGTFRTARDDSSELRRHPVEALRDVPPMACRTPPQHGHALLAGSITISSRSEAVALLTAQSEPRQKDQIIRPIMISSRSEVWPTTPSSSPM